MTRYRTVTQAFRSAVYDKLTAPETVQTPSLDIRIDGRTCLVTGANSGLGKAVAIDLAARGGRVLMACRSGHPEAGDAVRRASGSTDVEMLEVDLADLDSVHRLCDELAQRRLRLDVAVLNAGLITRTGRHSAQGYELMFAVHFLANRVMVDRWLRDGVVRLGGGAADVPRDAADVPRIVQVTSETHRSADPIEFDRLGEFQAFGMRDGLKFYGLSKLCSCTFAKELDRRLNPGGNVEVAVHALCPGPIATGIAREAPLGIKLVAQPLMRLLFASPEKAARPVSYLACDPAAGRASGMYLHMMRERDASPLASDPYCGERLWEASQKLIDRHAQGGG